MPLKIIHIVKLWGKGGVEDYINSLQKVESSKHELQICSQISFFKIKKLSKKNIYLFHTPAYIFPILYLKIIGIPHKVILHNEPFRKHFLKDLYFLFNFLIHSMLRTKIYVWSQNIKTKLLKLNLNVELMPMFDQTKFLKTTYSDTKKVIFVARYDTQKNIDLFLKITEENKDFNFYVYGYGYPSQFFNKYKNIFFKGFVSDKDVIYDDGILLCTSHYEGGPLVALEALSYGLPIITTHVGVFYDFKTNTQKIDSINSFKTIEEANQILDIFRNKKNFYSDNNLQYLEENFLSSTEVVNKIYE